jgi:hypothetical protein
MIVLHVLHVLQRGQIGDVHDCVHIILVFLGVEQIEDVATKELQLVGMSSGSRTAAVGVTTILLHEGWSSRGKEHDGGGDMICNSASWCYNVMYVPISMAALQYVQHKVMTL